MQNKFVAGKGCFGTVVLGNLEGNDVAIKSFKNQADFQVEFAANSLYVPTLHGICRAIGVDVASSALIFPFITFKGKPTTLRKKIKTFFQK